MMRAIRWSCAFGVVAVLIAGPSSTLASVRSSGHGALVSEGSERFERHPAPWRSRLERQRAGRYLTAEVAKLDLERMVYGYLPYWEMGYEVPHWNLLGVLAWFGVDIDEQGHAIDWKGWGGDATEALVAEAHAYQTPVVVTVTLFDDEGIAALLASETARAQTIETCLELMAVHGADGVNIDFEFVPGSAKENFVTFMKALKEAVTAAQPNGWDGHVTLAGPAVDWGGGFDYDQLLQYTDGIMIMGYGYHYGGGDPGPNAPLYGGGFWGPHSVAWTIDDYLTFGGSENRSRIIFGLPWYGRSWPVANTDVPGVALANGSAVWFDVALAEAATYGTQFDETSRTPYYHKDTDGTLRQVWYDDPSSFAEKVAYIVEKDLGGIGLWALGYEGDVDAYWQVIADHLTAVAPEPGTPIADVVDSSDTSGGFDGEEGGDAPGVLGEIGPEDDLGDDLVNAPYAAPTVGQITQSTQTHVLSSEGCSGGPDGRFPLWLLLSVVLGGCGTILRRRPS